MLNNDNIYVFNRLINVNKYAKIFHVLSITLNSNFGFQILTAIKIIRDVNCFWNLVIEIYMSKCLAF